MSKKFQYTAALLLAATALGGCEKTAVIDLVQCVAADDVLSVAFRKPAQAKAYLADLGARMKANDPEATKDAADLVAAVQGCIP